MDIRLSRALFGLLCALSGILIAKLLDGSSIQSIPNNSSLSSLLSPLKSSLPGAHSLSSTRPKATFLTLTRNTDLYPLSKSIRSIEDRFNKHHHYPWIFLNDAPFTSEFISVTSSLISGPTHYGVVPTEHWSYPPWINQTLARQERERVANSAEPYPYAESESYRHMCRFFSGFFQRHELLKDFEWYWRVEPETEIWCDVQEDPFVMMEKEGKKYGFVISIGEWPETIRSLWGSVREFLGGRPELVVEGNSMEFLSDGEGGYSGCHFWSNFEIANLNWLRSQEYQDFFDFLDQKGGFFYERWGDAPVHSLAAGLMLKKEEVHFFNEIAYSHPPYLHCPTGEPLKRELKCHCDRKQNFDWTETSCLEKYFALREWPFPDGYVEELPLVLEEEARVRESQHKEDADKQKVEEFDKTMAIAEKLITMARKIVDRPSRRRKPAAKAAEAARPRE